MGTITYRLVSESILELHAINSGPVLVCVRLRRICLGARSGVRHAHCHLHIGRRRSDISLGSLLEEHGWLLLLIVRWIDLKDWTNELPLTPRGAFVCRKEAQWTTKNLEVRPCLLYKAANVNRGVWPQHARFD
jgi:hypothetical protein